MKVLYLSSALPRKCGIATFTDNIIKNVKGIEQGIVAVNNGTKFEYPSLVKWEIQEKCFKDYAESAEFINFNADVFFLQYASGLFGGEEGHYILNLLKHITIPTVVFLHGPGCAYSKPTTNKKWGRRILDYMSEHNAYSIVSSPQARGTLVKAYHFPKDKVKVIHHGSPNVKFPTQSYRDKLKEKYGVAGKFVVVTIGLLREGKGIKYALTAMKKLRKKYPQLVYALVGNIHPLDKLIIKTSESVIHIDKFFSEKDFVEAFAMADVVLCPYLDAKQICSGTLAYAMATGSCVVTTPFIAARELLGDRYEFIEYRNSKSIVAKIADLIDNPQKIKNAQKRVYKYVRKYTHKNIGNEYKRLFKSLV